MPKQLDQLISQQIRRSEIARQRGIKSGAVCKSCVITISRRMGSGARIIAGKLADELGWSVWDKELVNAIAENAEISNVMAEAFDERSLSEMELLVRAIMGQHRIAGFVYAKHLAKAVASISKLGNAIILGRGANFLLPDALHIRIDASDCLRINNMMEYEGLTREQAEKKIKDSDRIRLNFLRATYGKNQVKDFHYDLTLWMDRFTNDQAVKIILAAVKERFPEALLQEA